MKKLSELDIFNRPAKPFNLEDFGGLREDEYVMNDVIMCRKCDTPRMFEHNNGRKVRCFCECQGKARDRAEKERKRETERQERMGCFKSISILENDRFKKARFENTETGHNPLFDNAYIRCKKYCEVSNNVLRDGLGMYIYGEASGTGKTRLAACMAHELIRQGHTVVLTNFIGISTLLRSTFGKSGIGEADYITRLVNLDFLMIDDIGTERVQTKDGDLWLQEKIFEILDKRHNAKKSTIFTSNNTVQSLVTERGFVNKTVDRIAGMSHAVLKIEGASYRMKARAAVELPF